MQVNDGVGGFLTASTTHRSRVLCTEPLQFALVTQMRFAMPGSLTVPLRGEFMWLNGINPSHWMLLMS